MENSLSRFTISKHLQYSNSQRSTKYLVFHTVVALDREEYNSEELTTARGKYTGLLALRANDLDRFCSGEELQF